jgi:hypothetical protein
MPVNTTQSARPEAVVRPPVRFTVKLKRLLLPIALFLGASCDSILPTQTKPYVPADHTRDISGALHKPGEGGPAAEENGCTDCHGLNLTGAVQTVGSRRVVAPSCYQCHGALWESGGNNGESSDD